MPDEEDDFFAPPEEPVEVFCLHCGNVYSSSEIKFVPCAQGQSFRNGIPGDWMCPAPGCDGVGYHFDIHSIEEWESDDDEDDDDSFTNEDDSSIDEEDSFLEVDDFDEAFSEEEAPGIDPFAETDDFLRPASENPEDAFYNILRGMNWWDTHDHPYVRLWQMRLDFHDRPMRLSEDPQQTYKPFNEDDIPF